MLLPLLLNMLLSQQCHVELQLGMPRTPSQPEQQESSNSSELTRTCCVQVLSMVRGLTAPELYAATEHNLHEFAVNVRSTDLGTHFLLLACVALHS